MYHTLAYNPEHIMSSIPRVDKVLLKTWNILEYAAWA